MRSGLERKAPEPDGHVGFAGPALDAPTRVRSERLDTQIDPFQRCYIADTAEHDDADPIIAGSLLCKVVTQKCTAARATAVHDKDGSAPGGANAICNP